MNKVTAHKQKVLEMNQDLWQTSVQRPCFIDTGLVYPPGAGGNFLLSCLQSDCQVSASSANEYFYPDSVQSPLDVYPTATDTFLDKDWSDRQYVESVVNLYNNKYVNNVQNKNKFYLHHFFPTILSMTCNLHIDDLIVVNESKYTFMLTNLIKELKLFATRDFNSPHAIEEIFYHNWPEVKQLDQFGGFEAGTWNLAYISLNELLPSIQYNSTMHWRYILHTQIYKQYVNKKTAKKFLQEFFNTYFHLIQHYAKHLNHDYYQASLEDAATYTRNLHLYEYDELFFDLKIPDKFFSFWKTKDTKKQQKYNYRKKVAEYSNRTLAQIKEIMPFITNRHYKRVMNKLIQHLQKKLYTACTGHHIKLVDITRNT